MARQCSSFLLNWTKSEFNVFHNVIDGRVAGPILMIFLIIHTRMMSAGPRGYNQGLGAEPPKGVQGQSPGGGQGGFVGGQGAKPPEADEVLCLKH